MSPTASYDGTPSPKDSVAKHGGVEGTGTSPDGAIEIMWISPVIHVLVRTALHAFLIQAAIMAIDYHFYGKLTSPIWNIFVYNAQAGGDELYGVEPLSYYIKNMLLNFNYVSVLGTFALPVVLVRKGLLYATGGGRDVNSDAEDSNVNNGRGLKLLVLIPMYIWMAIVLPRPHKEERFLFPIYPLLGFGAAIVLEEGLALASRLIRRFWWKEPPSAPLSVPLPPKHEKKEEERRGGIIAERTKLLTGLALLLPFAVLSISRSVALNRNYVAPLALYRELHYRAGVTGDRLPSSFLGGAEASPTTYVCTAGEWHRFPSSFFLPSGTELRFLKSSFGGQLPQPFTPFGSKKESLTIQAGKFNDVNKEETDRYVDINQCTFVVELVDFDQKNNMDDLNVPECLRYMQSDHTATWSEVASYQYLDAEKTPALQRILYIPFGRKGGAVFKGYTLYKRLAE